MIREGNVWLVVGLAAIVTGSHIIGSTIVYLSIAANTVAVQSLDKTTREVLAQSKANMDAIQQIPTRGQP